MSDSQRRERGYTLLVAGPDGARPVRVPSWALSVAAFALLVGVIGLGVFGVYNYVRAQRLESQARQSAPDPRTRELQRAILEQQSRVQSLQDDYVGVARQAGANQARSLQEIDRLQERLRELDRQAAELRQMLGMPTPPPTPPPPRSQAPGTDFALAAPAGSARVIGPYDIAFPAIDPDPYNLALQMDVLRTQMAARAATFRSLRADLEVQRAAEQAILETARAEAIAARAAEEAAAREQAAAEARAAAEAAQRKAVSSDPLLARLDNQVASVIERLRLGAPLTPQPKQVLSIPLPKDGPGAPSHWPLKGDVTSPFGYRVFRGAPDFHTGMDIEAAMQTEVHVTQGGTVVFAGWQAGYGWCVEVGHGQGYSTLYGHLSRISVDVGDKVAADSIIGLSGSSGNSTGPHLHYEIRLNGKAVDPSAYLGVT
ncbi:MAG: peptidoglycan DD-metalloendopeptidase family protein [Anaerolineae bacterium]